MATNTCNAHTIGLTCDSTAVALGWNKHEQCDVNDWHNIVAVAAGWRRTIGLKSDGTVVAVGRNKEGECNVSSWQVLWQSQRVTGIQSVLNWTAH